MSGGSDDVLGAKAPNDVPRLVKLGIGGETRTRAGVAVEEAYPRQLGGGRAYIGCIGYQVAEVTFQTQGPGLQVGVAKLGIDAIDGQRSDQVGGRERGKILLVAVYIHDGVGMDSLGAIGENVLPRGRVGERQLVRRDLEAIRDRRCGGGGEAGINGKWIRAGEEIVLVKIGRDGGNTAGGADVDLRARQPIELDARSQAIKTEAIPRLGIDNELLFDAGGGVGKNEAGGSLGALGDRRVELVALSVIKHQAGRDLPRVLGIKRKGVAV